MPLHCTLAGASKFYAQLLVPSSGHASKRKKAASWWYPRENFYEKKERAAEGEASVLVRRIKNIDSHEAKGKGRNGTLASRHCSGCEVCEGGVTKKKKKTVTTGLISQPTPVPKKVGAKSDGARLPQQAKTKGKDLGTLVEEAIQ